MWTSDKLLQVLTSIVIIAVITWIGDRYRSVAGVLATMPLTIPITLVIVFQNTGGDHVKVAEFTQAAVAGIVGTVCFLLAAWWAVSRHYGVVTTILAGYAAWAIALVLGRTVLHLFPG